MSVKTEKHPKTEIPRGRAYLCIGPNCWGKAFDARDAEKAAKENFSISLVGKWRFIMFDVPPDAFVGGMGDISYNPTIYRHDPESQQPLIGYAPKELYRWNMPKENAA